MGHDGWTADGCGCGGWVPSGDGAFQLTAKPPKKRAPGDLRVFFGGG